MVLFDACGALVTFVLGAVLFEATGALLAFVLGARGAVLVLLLGVGCVAGWVAG